MEEALKQGAIGYCGFDKWDVPKLMMSQNLSRDRFHGVFIIEEQWIVGMS